jgi:hypothetical protein
MFAAGPRGSRCHVSLHRAAAHHTVDRVLALDLHRAQLAARTRHRALELGHVGRLGAVSDSRLFCGEVHRACAAPGERASSCSIGDAHETPWIPLIPSRAVSVAAALGRVGPRSALRACPLRSSLRRLSHRYTNLPTALINSVACPSRSVFGVRAGGYRTHIDNFLTGGFSRWPVIRR